MSGSEPFYLVNFVIYATVLNYYYFIINNESNLNAYFTYGTKLRFVE